jgi:DeoR/GlpR family transcriptional regulator of sugar metabolism
MTGGALRGSTLALLGSLAEEALAHIRVRSAFLSGNGLTAERGLSTPVMASAGVDHAITRCAQEIVVLADHTKIGVDTMFQTVPVESIRHLVTDEDADPLVLSKLSGKGVQVHLARVRSGAHMQPVPAEPVR